MTVCLWTAARLGLVDKAKAYFAEGREEELNSQDKRGRTPLHEAAAAGQEEVLELLLEKGAACNIQDAEGNTPLHLAANASPMCAYQVASKAAAACLSKNKAGLTPCDLAAASERSEVLNALLLACSGQRGSEALHAMEQLLKAGAVCDTWAPNGSSALMLAAAIDCTPGVELLLGNGATVELQDALGRTALMFAAGNDAQVALAKLLEAGASVSIRDRRGRNVMDYAVDGSGASKVLQQHLKELESKATELQAALLAELCGDDVKAQPAAQQAKPKKSSKKKKGGKGKGSKSAAAEAAAAPSLAAVKEEEEEEEELADAAASRGGNDAPAEQLQQEQQQRQQGGDEEERAPHPPAPASEAASDLEACVLFGNDAHSGVGDGSSRRTSMDVCEGEGEGEGEGCYRSPSPPDSPGWCTVVGKPQRQQSKPMAVPQPAAPPQLLRGLVEKAGGAGSAHLQHQHQHHSGGSHGSRGCGGRLEVGSLDSAMSRVRRIPSNGSLASSSCSGESHDTEFSRLSGSERSVLRPVLSRRPAASGAQPSAAAKLLLKHHLDHSASQAAGKGGRALPPTASWATPRAELNAHAHTQPAWSAAEGGDGAAAQPAAAAAAAAAGGFGSPEVVAVLPAHPDSAPAAALATAEDAPGSASGSGMSSPQHSSSDAVSAELAALREQVARLQWQHHESEFRHRQELAAVLEDAAAHEARAVQQAVSAERMSCIIRFTSFLQRSGSTLCSAFPELFGASRQQAQQGGLLGGECGTAPLRIPRPQQQQQQHFAAGSGISSSLGSSFGGLSPLESLLATMANNQLGLAQSPSAGGGLQGVGSCVGSPFSSLGFPPVGLSKFGSQQQQQQRSSIDGFGSLLDGGSPLSGGSSLASAPFSFQDVEARLRGEYQGNHSAFVVPAAAEGQPGSPLGDDSELGLGGSGSELGGCDLLGSDLHFRLDAPGA